MKLALALAAGAALSVAGCATPPVRSFAPVMADRPADLSAFRTAFDGCAAQLGGVMPAPVNAAGAAARAAAESAAGDVLVKSTVLVPLGATGGGFGPEAVVLAPLVAVEQGLVARGAAEDKIKAQMSACLAARGFQVRSWRPLKPKEVEGAAYKTPS
jgi:hypothetical protein